MKGIEIIPSARRTDHNGTASSSESGILSAIRSRVQRGAAAGAQKVPEVAHPGDLLGHHRRIERSGGAGTDFTVRPFRTTGPRAIRRTRVPR
jgi:hypothetical protein